MSRWLVGAIPVSAWLTWMAWQGPPEPTQYMTPPSIERPVHEEAKKSVIETAIALTQSIQRAQTTRNHAIATSQLEGVDELGRPYLDQPIPDNALMPGIASIMEACPATDQQTQHDWVYCPQTGNLLAVINGQSVSGKE